MYNCPNIKPKYKLTKTIFIYNRLFRHDINKQKTFKRIQTEVDQEKKSYLVGLEKEIHSHLNKSTMLFNFLKTMGLCSVTIEAASSLRLILTS